jgi:cation diffusion facilitator family transporter
MRESRAGSSNPRKNVELGDRTQAITRASWIGILGNGVLSAAKIVFGFLASSMAVVSDGVDSGLDVLTSSITLVAARITAKPPDLDHPYGHSRAETIATKSLSFIIFFAGAQLAVGTLGALIRGEVREVPSSTAIYVTVASILGKVFLAIHKYRVGRRHNSPMLVADARNMRADIVISVAVLAGIAFTLILKLPVLDRITALAVSVWIMVVAFRIFLETTDELMEGFREPETYQRVFDAVTSVPGAHHPHRARIRTVGIHRVVDLDIEVDGRLSVTEAHEIARQAEAAVRSAVDNVYDVLIHVEPVGNIERQERYGVSQRTLNASHDKRH